MQRKKNSQPFFDYLYNLKSVENYPYIPCMSAMPKWLHITVEDESEYRVKKSVM